MSHTVQIQTQIRDVTAVRAACTRLLLPEPVEGVHRLFSGQVIGLGVQLPAWRYPVVCNLTSGELQYDNFNGRWGEQRHLEKFLQSYAVEKSKIEARKAGHSVSEQALADGSIKVLVQVGGVA